MADARSPDRFETVDGECVVSRAGLTLHSHRSKFLIGIPQGKVVAALMLYAAALLATLALWLIVSAALAFIAFGAIMVVTCAAALIMDVLGGRSTQTLELGLGSILSVVPNPPQPRISRGHFVVHCNQAGALTRYVIMVRGGDEPGGDYRHAERVLREHNLLFWPCVGCTQLLTPEQVICPECGLERTAPRG